MKKPLISILIDIGGTYIRIGVDQECNNPLNIIKTPIAKADLLNVLEKEIKKVLVEKDIKETQIFISCPGLINKKGEIQKTLYVPLTGVKLADEISRRLGSKVLVVNDANIQALGCYEENSLLYMNIGTAIGGAYVIDNRLFLGGDGFACEFGHVFIGTKDCCICGRTGCLDTVASGLCFEKKFGDKWWENKDNFNIREQIKIAGRAVGEALAQVSILFNPEEICVTGRVSTFSEFQEYTRTKFYENSWYDIPIRFKDDSWKNVYLGFKKIIEGECIL